MRILVADDDTGVLEYLRTLFEDMGHEVMTVENAKECLKTLVVHEPDLVLLDIVMPDKDGLDLLKEIKELDREATVVMITAYKNAEKVIEAFRYGAADCLLKPFNVEYIKDAILTKVRTRRR